MRNPSLILATAVAAISGPMLTPAPAYAQPSAAPASPLPAEHQALVRRAIAYLEGLGPMQGRFVQLDPKGKTSSGRFFLDRPGRARLEYDAPSALVIVCDGRSVLVHERRLGTFENYSLRDTPLSLFLAEKVSFDVEAVVENVSASPDAFTITVRDDRRQPASRIALTFSDAPVALRDWSLTDPKGQRTTVTLTELLPAGRLDPGLFVLQDPRLAAGPR